MIRDEESGRIQRKATDEEVLQAIKDGYVTSLDISKKFDVHQVIARQYLNRLLEQGKVERRQIGTAYVYRRVEK